VVFASLSASWLCLFADKKIVTWRASDRQEDVGMFLAVVSGPDEESFVTETLVNKVSTFIRENVLFFHSLTTKLTTHVLLTSNKTAFA
jgi:hypothetical protein